MPSVSLQIADRESLPQNAKQPRWGRRATVGATLRGFAVALLGSAGGVAMAQATVTFTGNNGVLLAAGDEKVLIDTLWDHGDTFWTRLPGAERAKLFAAQAPFDSVDWALTTHAHSDHFNVQAVNLFLTNSPTTRFIGPPQVTSSGGLRTNPQTTVVAPLFQSSSVIVGSPGIEVEVFLLEHFDQFGNDFSRIQDYAYLVTLGGVRVLHLGDVDYIPQNFAAFGFASRGIDAVVIPTFNTLLTEANANLIRSAIAPRTIIATHLRAGSLATEVPNVRRRYPEATIFTTALDSITLHPVPEPTAGLLASVALAALSGPVARRRRRPPAGPSSTRTPPVARA
ncbi:MAG: MBL fold metallo-hydrolase [Lacipirellulaceae bacterium]